MEIEVVGYDLAQLRNISRTITQRMGTMPRYTDIKSTVETGHPEIRILFDRERAAALGLPVHRAA